MTRAEILTLATSLSLITPDNDTLTRFYDDAFAEFQLRPDAQILSATIKVFSAGTATYTFESDMFRLFAAFYDDEQLSLSSVNEANAYAQLWRASSGTPKAIIQDETTAQEYTVFPEPSVTSAALIPTHGEPYGEDYPANNAVLVYADNRTSDILDIFALPLAFETLSKEFTYPSDRTDADFATVCQTIATLLYKLIGYK